MAYDHHLTARVSEFLRTINGIEIEEKEMFGGLAFLVNGKMCVNVGDDLLMCRFDPQLTAEISERIGFLPMMMKGRAYKGYCYVEPIGYRNKRDLEFWIHLCLDFNDSAKSSKK